MKLCWLVPNDHGGGVISVALSCCRQAQAAGHEVTLLLLKPPTGHIDEYATIPHDAIDGGRDEPETPRRLVDWLKKRPQDVLLLNDCSPVHPALPYIPADTRTVFVVHDTAVKYWRPALRHESVLDAIVAVSHSVAREFQAQLGAPDTLNVLHNGTLFPSDIQPKPTGQRSDDLLFLGGSKPFKGAPDVLKVWPLLNEAGYRGRLHWFGRIEPAFRSRIERLPETHRIVLHGRAQRSAIFRQAAFSRVLLVPSRVEPFGMVTIEGMGMGAIPVAWDIETGTKEIVSPGKTGFLAPLGRHAIMAQQVIEALRRHEEMAPRAVKDTRERFSEEAMWRRYAALLERLAVQPQAARPLAGGVPAAYQPPVRYFQRLPKGLRRHMRALVARSPHLSYWVRNLRGI